MACDECNTAHAMASRMDAYKAASSLVKAFGFQPGTGDSGDPAVTPLDVLMVAHFFAGETVIGSSN